MESSVKDVLSSDLHSSIPGQLLSMEEEEGGSAPNSSEVMWPSIRFQVLKWF